MPRKPGAGPVPADQVIQSSSLCWWIWKYAITDQPGPGPVLPLSRDERYAVFISAKDSNRTDKIPSPKIYILVIIFLR